MAAPSIGARPPGTAPDWTMPQRWADYTAEEHRTWDTLFARQQAQLADRAAAPYLRGLEILRAEGGGIPDFELLSEHLTAATGWRVVCVPGLVPEAVFFEHLAHRRFVAGRFIRRPDQLDYLEEPDIFHDVFGHVPLLADPVFAAFLQAYGERASSDPRLVHRMARLYWHTIEFGLVREDGRLKLYGAGIVSSHGESAWALDSEVPPRIAFDLPRVLRTDYITHTVQPAYVVLDSFAQLLARTLETDFVALSAELDQLPDIAPGELVPSDRVIARDAALAEAA